MLVMMTQSQLSFGSEARCPSICKGQFFYLNLLLVYALIASFDASVWTLSRSSTLKFEYLMFICARLPDCVIVCKFQT